MKIGDKVFSTKFRINKIATVIKTNFQKIETLDLETGKTKSEIRSMYEAIYDDGHKFKFYGASVGRTIFKYTKPKKKSQLSIFDMGVKDENEQNWPYLRAISLAKAVRR